MKINFSTTLHENEFKQPGCGDCRKNIKQLKAVAIFTKKQYPKRSIGSRIHLCSVLNICRNLIIIALIREVKTYIAQISD